MTRPTNAEAMYSLQAQLQAEHTDHTGAISFEMLSALSNPHAVLRKNTGNNQSESTHKKPSAR